MTSNNETNGAITNGAAPRKAVQIHQGVTDDETRRNYAVVATSPELAAYRVINGAEHKSGLGESIDVPALMAYLREQAQTVNGGNLEHAEAMLMNQATALQSLFARLAERAMTCDTVPSFDANMRMALRSQSQCRATLETLAAIKNPAPVAFVRQANISAGLQQVNNGLPPTEPPRAREIKSTPIKLSEVENELPPNIGASTLAIGADSQVEALAAIDRTDDRER
jgi:hypothetical protein